MGDFDEFFERLLEVAEDTFETEIIEKARDAMESDWGALTDGSLLHESRARRRVDLGG